MSEREQSFLNELEDKFYAWKKEFQEEADKKYSRMQVFLLSILTVIIGASLTIGSGHFTKDGETRATVATLKERQDIVLKNAVSQKAIDDLIYIYEERTKVMQEFLPNDIKGYIKASNALDNNFRSYILQYQSGINVRSAKEANIDTNGGSK